MAVSYISCMLKQDKTCIGNILRCSFAANMLDYVKLRGWDVLNSGAVGRSMHLLNSRLSVSECHKVQFLFALSLFHQ